jgi:uncharacterized damage-inducible protein DinB
LQPVAHALLQVMEDLPSRLEPLSHEQVWAQLGRSAPIGYHLLHLTGSLDRLLTYARGESLSAEQRAALVAEGTRAERRPPRDEMLARLRATLERALAQVRDTPESTLDDARPVGRAQLPSTVRGLLAHAAEHTTRHAAQIMTLVRVLEGHR